MWTWKRIAKQEWPSYFTLTNGTAVVFCFEDTFPLFTSHLALRLACLFASMWACFSARTDPSPVVFAFLLLIYWLLRSERCHFLSVAPHSFAAHRDHLQLVQTLPFPFSRSLPRPPCPLYFFSISCSVCLLSSSLFYLLLWLLFAVFPPQFSSFLSLPSLPPFCSLALSQWKAENTQGSWCN